ncbi:MAG: hypothetical protein JEY71_04515 [Sphaerochaeta sp.]|nr:hypothetical protein [Sphaerochaeta sp.]
MRLVHSSDELKEKILLADAGLDDKAIELCKMYLLMKMERKAHTLLYADHQGFEAQMFFSLFNEKDEMQETIQCSDGLYTQLMETAKEFSLKKGYFLCIDQAWAFNEMKGINTPGQALDPGGVASFSAPRGGVSHLAFPALAR